MIRISYINAAGETVSAASHETEVHLCTETDYGEGDMLVINCTPCSHLWVQMDAALMPGEIYSPTGIIKWRVPYGHDRDAYSPAVSVPGRHAVSARIMSQDEIRSRRNIACNPSDLRGDVDFYPHCTANVETRGEALFAARNVIDGYRINSGHWGWPYQSWGIGGRDDACCTIDFGREVEIDEMAIVIRADFPHDAWWSQGQVVLSDGDVIDFPLTKTADRQFISLGPHRVSWMRLQNLKQDPSADGFPALTEWEVYGRDV